MCRHSPLPRNSPHMAAAGSSRQSYFGHFRRPCVRQCDLERARRRPDTIADGELTHVLFGLDSTQWQEGHRRLAWDELRRWAKVVALGGGYWKSG